MSCSIIQTENNQLMTTEINDFIETEASSNCLIIIPPIINTEFIAFDPYFQFTKKEGWNQVGNPTYNTTEEI